MCTQALVPGALQTMLLTANLLPVMCFSIAFTLNTIAIFYQSLAAVPFGSIVVVLLIWCVSALLSSLKPIGYTWSYLACRIGRCRRAVHLVRLDIAFITETSRTHLVLFGMQNRTLPSCCSSGAT
jgi:Endomembrane protein 70